MAKDKHAKHTTKRATQRRKEKQRKISYSRTLFPCQIFIRTEQDKRNNIYCNKITQCNSCSCHIKSPYFNFFAETILKFIKERFPHTNIYLIIPTKFPEAIQICKPYPIQSFRILYGENLCKTQYRL